MSPTKAAAETPRSGIAASEIAPLFSPLKGYRHLAIAVSGGPDSTALMLLAAQWKGKVKFSVLTIDHGLRRESAEEARQVKRWARKLGLPAYILTWQSPTKSAVQARAREARYRLMAQWCAQHEAEGVVTAHTLDDQAETLLMRLARGSGIDGLSAMASETWVHGVKVLRPLLDIPRERLRNFLESRGHGYFSDPSNDNPAFERVRIRKAGRLLASVGLKPEALALTARRLHRARQALERATDELEASAVAPQPEGHAIIDLKRLSKASEEIQLRLIFRLLERVGGTSASPQLSEVERLGQWLLAGGGLSRTLGGCRVQRRSRILIVGRESGRMRCRPITIRPGETLVWDDRFKIRLDQGSGRSLKVLPLGAAKDRRQVKRPKNLPDFVFKTLPALTSKGQVALVPQLGYSRPGASPAVKAEVVPLLASS
jgi:tRNA(Ile)-lysidine synthase